MILQKSPRAMVRTLLCLGALAWPVLGQATTLEDAIKAIEIGSGPKAAEQLIKLANEGNSLAQYRLGNLYYNGQLVPEDETLAIHWWKKSAAQGNAEAMFQIGQAYLFGTAAAKHVNDPDREAALWYFQAASAGHAESAYTLGLLFLAGKGVVESKTEAIRWFKRAADKGHAEARKAIETADKVIVGKPRK